MAASSHGWFSGLLTFYGIGVLAWSIRNALAVQTVGRLFQPEVPTIRHGRITTAVLVTGATGFIGAALIRQLAIDGHRVIAWSRDALQAGVMFGPNVWVVESLDAIPSETQIDHIVNLAGARVLGLPWTSARRRELLSSRVNVTAAVVDLMRRLQQRPRALISASAVGFYGASPQNSFAPLDESQAARPGEFQSDLCIAIEHEATRAQALGVRVVRLRFGIVLGRGNGAYPMLALSSRFGLGAVMGSGQQAVPWVHLADAVGLIRFAMHNEHLKGAVNAVAPSTPSQTVFAQTMAASFSRRMYLRLPAAPLRALLGEMSTLLLDGQNAIPAAATLAGYTFTHPTLAGALEDLACKSSKTLHERQQQPAR